MRVIDIIACIYVLFVSAVGFLFGQMFAGVFTIGGTVAGIAGLIAGVTGLVARNNTPRLRVVSFWTCVAALVGVAIDATHYYLVLDIPGNFYAWGLIAPFCAALLFIAHTTRSGTLWP